MVTEGSSYDAIPVNKLLHPVQDEEGADRVRKEIQVLRCMIEDNGLTQSALVGPVSASTGIASEILSGKRELTLNHIRRLAEYFHTSPAVFMS